MKNNISRSYYFPHDYNAANDVKILYLRNQYGILGYGLYWFILEQLAQAGGILELKSVSIIAMQSGIEEKIIIDVIKNFNLFVVTKDSFHSVRMNVHLGLRKVLSDKGKEGAKKRWGNNRVAISNANAIPFTDANAKKEIKETKKFVKPSQEDIKKYIKETGYGELAANEQSIRIYDFYESKGWKVGKSPMKDWKAATRNWLRNTPKEKEEIKPKIKLK